MPVANCPKGYYRLSDPFLALTAAATVTRTLLLGTGVALIAQRDSIITAKEVATLDQLSNGRFLFGVGIRWNRKEMESHGTDPKARAGHHCRSKNDTSLRQTLDDIA
jgi:alkanesulfonate monooxygenase SsuD/methylene tetrahydromethanopterin reductase-like flavin-dependent oxidoreductase (luciferase family)